MKRVAALIVVMAAASSCASPSGLVATGRRGLPAEVRSDTEVAGEVRIRGEVKVLAGATLYARPGARFLLEPYDPDGDGVNDSRLVVEGRIEARGDETGPVVFTSAAANPQPGDWLELRIDNSEGSVLEHCVLEYSRYGIHAHFSSGVVSDCAIRRNIDGTRFGNSSFLISRNLVEDNIGKGLNARESTLRIERNRFVRNRHALFFFEEAGDVLVFHNDFFGSEVTDVRFGDFYEGLPPRFEDNLGSGASDRLIVEGMDLVANTRRPSPDGRRGPLGLRSPSVRSTPLWETEVGGYVDAPPIAAGDGRILVSTWKGDLLALSSTTGSVLSRAVVGDVVDAAPAPVPGSNAFLFPAWDRTIRVWDARTSSVTTLATWTASAADDHRQASAVPFQGGMAIGLWNGEFGVMDPGNGSWSWKTTLDGAVRAAALADGESLWVGTDGGSLYHLDTNGSVLARLDLGSPVRSTPALLGSGSVAAVSRDGVLFRADEDRITWRRRLSGPGTYAPPVFAQRIMTGDGSGAVSCRMPEDGALLWATSLGSAVHALSVQYGLVYAGTEDGLLAVLSPDTGRVLAQVRAGGAVHGAPLLLDGPLPVLIWASRDGTVRALTLNVGERSPWSP